MTGPFRVSDEELLERFQNSSNHPPGSRTLDFRIEAIAQAEMRVEASFFASPDFCNPMGQVQGGFLCAMLDEVMSVAGVVASGMADVMPTLEMKTSFLRPALPNQRLRGVGRVLRRGRTIAFTEGELFDADGRLLAKATATALPTPRARFAPKPDSAQAGE